MLVGDIVDKSEGKTEVNTRENGDSVRGLKETSRGRIRMTGRADMTNGHGMCHGGYMFLLADSTFAFACNSHNLKMVAASAEVHFVAPAREGDTLTAEGREQHRAGRSGLYDVRVTDHTGRTVALFRGKSAAICGAVLPATEPPPGHARD